MPVFASRSPRRDAARRASPLSEALRSWALPAAILCGWFAAGTFSLSALDGASSAWRARRAPRAAFEEEIEVRPPALATRRISRVRPATLQRPGCPGSARVRRLGAQRPYDRG